VQEQMAQMSKFNEHENKQPNMQTKELNRFEAGNRSEKELATEMLRLLHRFL
jgi:hypothetical protein